MISESLKTELDATRKRLSRKTFELDEMKEQLMDVLLSKDKIQKQLETAVAAGVPNEQPEEAPNGKKEDAEKIEKLRAALRQKMEVSQDVLHDVTCFARCDMFCICSADWIILPYSNSKNPSKTSTTCNGVSRLQRAEVHMRSKRYVSFIRQLACFEPMY